MVSVDHLVRDGFVHKLKQSSVTLSKMMQSHDELVVNVQPAFILARNHSQLRDQTKEEHMHQSRVFHKTRGLFCRIEDRRCCRILHSIFLMQGFIVENMRLPSDHQDLWFRRKDPIELLKKMFANPQLQGHIKLRAQPEFNNAGDRCITGATSAERMINIQVWCVPLWMRIHKHYLEKCEPPSKQACLSMIQAGSILGCQS